MQGPQHAGVPLWPCLCRDCLIQRCLLKHSAASTFGQFYKGWVIRVEGDDNFDFSLSYHCIIIENPTGNSKSNETIKVKFISPNLNHLKFRYQIQIPSSTWSSFFNSGGGQSCRHTVSVFWCAGSHTFGSQVSPHDEASRSLNFTL